MNLDQALQLFIAEAEELLQDMENALLAVERADEKDELVNAIFRAAHTIKGSAGLFGLDHIVAFTHGVESLLEQVRAGEIVLSHKLVVLLLSSADHIGALVAAVAAGQTQADAELLAQGEPLTAELISCLGAPLKPVPVPPQLPVMPVMPQTQAMPTSPALASLKDQGGGQAKHWHISLRFGPEVLKNGMDPLSFIRYLQTLGSIVYLETLTDALPDAASMNPENCYLGFEIALHSDADQTTLENVFEFVRDDCRLCILPPHSPLADYARLIEQQGGLIQLGEVLLRCGTLSIEEFANMLATQLPTSVDQPAPVQAMGFEMVTAGVAPQDLPDANQGRQKQSRESAVPESRTIRVDADKLDQLINLVGELIIAGANVNLIARRAQIAELQESTSKLSTLVEDVRDSALQLRMVKIGATFNRFQRVVFDVARGLGKDIALVIDGEDTELDKTVVEKIGDPLMHLVRNAMDHGIEPAELRAARGKPVQGQLMLNAFHDSGSIVITVEDDGGGLSRERILAKAVERGLVEPEQILSDSEVYALIFEPGFSTAEAVTNLSGRGVGMDVVKRNISALRGTVTLSSQEGVGTLVTVRLPLTLAIIDGFLVGVDKSVFAIALDMIEECVAYSAEPGHDYTSLRGQVLPLIRLRSLFDMPGAPTRGQNIVVIKHGGQKAGLVVDSLLGEFQTVIKPLGAIFNQVKCISGSTILGSGDVALILDVPALVRRASQLAASRFTPQSAQPHSQQE
jgi:two-component system chemotaxis sensor kinase CheA